VTLSEKREITRYLCAKNPLPNWEKKGNRERTKNRGPDRAKSDEDLQNKSSIEKTTRYKRGCRKRSKAEEEVDVGEKAKPPQFCPTGPPKKRVGERKHQGVERPPPKAFETGNRGGGSRRGAKAGQEASDQNSRMGKNSGLKAPRIAVGRGERCSIKKVEKKGMSIKSGVPTEEIRKGMILQ